MPVPIPLWTCREAGTPARYGPPLPPVVHLKAPAPGYVLHAQQPGTPPATLTGGVTFRTVRDRPLTVTCVSVRHVRNMPVSSPLS